MEKALRKIFFWPFSVLYGLGISFRNALYDSELLKSSQFDIPVINIGNLSVGGTGKTPHVEYIANFLFPFLPVAILSRGYKRKSKGFRMIQTSDNAATSGDEPVMYKRKNPELAVAVSESRSLGIPLLLQKAPFTKVILLDDAFQHRSVKAGLNILVTPFDDLFTRDALMPSGRLREYPSAYLRAEIIVVSKCPVNLSIEERDEIIKEINPTSYQRIFFSSYKYFNAYDIFNAQRRIQDFSTLNVILITGIASADYLVNFMEEHCLSINQMSYGDHHAFRDKDLNYLKKVYDNAAPNTVILTTEKDAIRLQSHSSFIKTQQLPIFALPIKVQILFDQQYEFEQLIKNYLLNFKI